jgi:hypothetical protein
VRAYQSAIVKLEPQLGRHDSDHQHEVFMEMALSWAAVSAGVVALYWLKLHYGRRDRLPNSPELERLQEQAEAVNADVQSVYDELCDKIEQVNERLDFAERLLSQPRDSADESTLEETPRELTPT